MSTERILFSRSKAPRAIVEHDDNPDFQGERLGRGLKFLAAPGRPDRRPGVAVQRLTPTALEVLPIFSQFFAIPADFGFVFPKLLAVAGDLLARRAPTQVATKLAFVVEVVFAILAELSSVVFKLSLIFSQFAPALSVPPAIPPPIVIGVDRAYRHDQRACQQSSEHNILYWFENHENPPSA
jgi:hypothetical protein